MTNDVIMRKTRGRGQGARADFRPGFSAPEVGGDFRQDVARRETEADVRVLTAVVEFVARPIDNRFSFAIRSGSQGSLVRE